MSDDAELLAEFLAEGRENLARLEHELLSFEGQCTPEMLAATFRTAHTIKGNAGFFGFTKLQGVMHSAESLLSRIRDGELVLTSQIVSLLLDAADAAAGVMDALDATGTEGDGDHTALVAALDSFAGTAVAPEEAAPPPPVAVAPPPPVAVAPPPPAPSPAPPPPAAAAPPAHAPARAADSEPRTDTAVRVDTVVLDRLVVLAGELVLVRNQLLQRVSTDPGVARAIQRLDAVTSELQESVMKTRMQPVGNALAKLPRVVRDLAAELGKQVKLEISGEDTALDRSIVEAIRDPLTHLVRNAIDHGVETPERRLAAGKPALGTLAITASHEGGSVGIEIRDDGAGIDVARIRARALERGLLSPDAAARMSEGELVQMIFAPGFSTAEKVTSVSGRGVGMDVVRTNIEAIGGSVQISGARGEGTTVRLQIPLTLAIMPVLLVGVGGERYAIPETALVEILRIDPSDGGRDVEYIHGAPVYRRRGELIPLVGLADALAGVPPGRVATPAYVAVVAIDGHRLGLVVDDLHESEEIVVKPLGALVTAPCFGGATILGDGRVALIIDVGRLAAELGLRGRAARVDATPAALPLVSSPPMLVVRGRERRYAIPLGDVTRLEQFAVTAIERAGRLEVVQYHGRLLPLVRLGDPCADRATVVVYSDHGHTLGVLVESIIDVFNGDLAIDVATAMPGVRGSAVIDGFATDIVDVAAVAAASGLYAEVS